VGNCSTRVYLFGESSWITVRVASPLELNTVEVAGSKAVPSTLSPMGRVWMTFPFFAFITTRFLLWHPEKSRLFFTSMERPDGDSPGAKGQVLRTFRVLASILRISLL